jgi:hypothetical protein
MNKLMIACFAAAGLCGHLITANAATLENTTPVPPVTSSTTNRTIDLPYILAKLQGDVQTLQSEVQKLQSQKSQDPADPPESFSVVSLPNHDGSPIPNGDYPPGW